MGTVNSDIIEPALRDLGVLQSGEAATAADSADALVALNNLLDQWALEPLTVYTLTRTTKAITVSDGEYSVGTGGDVNIARPADIARVTLIDTNQTPDHEYPLTRLTEREYQDLPQKAQESERPDSWYYNPTVTTGTLYLFPVPTGTGLEFGVYVRTAVPQFASAQAAVTLPPGYERMLVKNLALELAPSYGVRSLNPLLVMQASDAKAAVKRGNQRAVKSQFTADVPGVLHSGGGYNIERG